jgi:hypothetical protein
MALQNLYRDLEGREDMLTDPPSTSASYLREFILRAIRHANEMPLDKLGRWTGFVQGVMSARGWISVQSERDRTRSLFTGRP